MSDDRIREIRRTLELFHEGRLVEIRAIGVPRGRSTITVGGYFDDYTLAAVAALKLNDEGAEGVYMTFNDIHPGLIARAANRIAESPHKMTGDPDAVKRRYVLIDVDAIRPSGISSTDQERRKAYDLRLEITQLLLETHDPVWLAWCSSGNGYHLVVDSWSFGWDSADSQSDIEDMLGGLDTTVASDTGCKIDTSVSNIAQITKLYGTTARKGDNIHDRPHRRSYVEGVWRKLGYNSDGTRNGDPIGPRVRTYDSGCRLLGAEILCPGV